MRWGFFVLHAVSVLLSRALSVRTACRLPTQNLLAGQVVFRLTVPYREPLFRGVAEYFFLTVFASLPKTFGGLETVLRSSPFAGSQLPNTLPWVTGLPSQPRCDGARLLCRCPWGVVGSGASWREQQMGVPAASLCVLLVGVLPRLKLKPTHQA